MEIATTKERILQFIEYKGISKQTFFKETGLKRGFLDADKLQTSIPDTFIATIIATYPEIDPLWLLLGKGSMLKEKKVVFQAPQLSPSESADLVRIPIVDISVAAGSGYNNPDYIEEVDSITMPASMIKSRKDYLCIRVKGHSMVPSILDGGYLVIRMLDRSEWESIRDNYVYVVTDTEGKAYVKRIKNRLRQHGFIVCMSDNADKMNYPNFNIYEEDLHTVWYAEWYFSAKIPNIQETYYRKQVELEDRMDELTNQIQQIKTVLNVNNKL